MKRAILSWMAGLLLAMGTFTVQADEDQPLALRMVMQE